MHKVLSVATILTGLLATNEQAQAKVKVPEFLQKIAMKCRKLKTSSLEIHKGDGQQLIQKKTVQKPQPFVEPDLLELSTRLSEGSGTVYGEVMFGQMEKTFHKAALSKRKSSKDLFPPQIQTEQKEEKPLPKAELQDFDQKDDVETAMKLLNTKGKSTVLSFNQLIGVKHELSNSKEASFKTVQSLARSLVGERKSYNDYPEKDRQELQKLSVEIELMKAQIANHKFRNQNKFVPVASSIKEKK